jgi:hypothetical protein
MFETKAINKTSFGYVFDSTDWELKQERIKEAWLDNLPENGKNSVYCSHVEIFHNNTTMINFVDEFVKQFPEFKFQFLSDSRCVLYAPNVMITLKNRSYSDGWSKGHNNIGITIYGFETSTLKMLHDHFKSKSTKQITIDWYYTIGGGDLVSTEKMMRLNTVFHDEFYPFIKGGVEAYCKRFDQSRSNVLILLGPPGTGKTSFIRQLLTINNAEAITTFDESVMNTDKFYVECFNNTKKYVIMEDADVLLTSREKEGNKIMNKILNSADGLVSSDDKKFIFTANITNLTKIDDALLRPGRCFDARNFRLLNQSEATIAAGKLGVPLPLNEDGTAKPEYALSEIFNQQNEKTRQKFGFAV